VIQHIDPKTPAYAAAYRRGWAAGERGAEGSLERGDLRNESHAWYDGTTGPRRASAAGPARVSPHV